MATEQLSLSLIREFLSSKGLRETLAKLDEEMPRTSESINNRVILARTLNMEQPIPANTESPTPCSTILEALVTSQSDQHKSSQKQIDSNKVRMDDKPITTKDVGNTDHHLLETCPTSKPTVLDHIIVSGTRASKGRKSISGQPLKGTAMTGELPSFLTNKEQEEPDPAVNKTTIRRASDYFSKSAASPRSMHNKQEINFSPPLVKKERMILNAIKTPVSSHTSSATSIGQDARLSPTLKTDSLPGIRPFFPTMNTSPFNLSTPPSPVPSHLSPNFVCMDTPLNEPPKFPQPTQNLFGRKDECLLYEDFEVVDMNFPMPKTSSFSGSTYSFKVPHGDMISTEKAQALKEVLFGANSNNAYFSKEWKKQNLVFSKVANLEYGLVQHLGGPCGVLASLQAHILKYLLFEDEGQTDKTTSPCPTPIEKKAALVGAMTEIIWRAGDNKKGVVTLLAKSSKITTVQGLLLSSDVISMMNVYCFQDKGCLKEFIENLLVKFMGETTCGCICFTLSVILSRGVAQVRADMDEAASTLIGSHNYCTQELVNLILVGSATSNVFDGEKSMEGTGTEKLIFKGISGPSDIGFLSLFEFYDSCQVGNWFKNPTYPIFVICCESHFIVMFSLTRNLMQDTSLQDHFDMYYYDGLAKQSDVIRLTIQCNGEENKQSLETKELSPPIELCIKTRWRSTIQWNGTEQLF